MGAFEMFTKKRLLFAASLSTTALVASLAAYGASTIDDTIKPKVDAIEAEYAPQFDKLKKDGEALGDYRPGDVAGVVGVDVKIGSHREDLYVKIPEFWMGLQRIVFTVPEVTMRQQRWVFHTPSVRMKRVQVGVHPEWFGLFHMEWKPNYMDVPEPFMQKQEVVLGVPEFKMGNQEIKLHLPQVAMREQHWVLDLPDFTVKDVHAEIGKRRSAAEDLQARGQGLAKEMKGKINQVLLEELPKKREQLVAAFDDGEKRIKDAIVEARKYNVDTSKAFADGQPALDDVLKSVQQQRATAIQQLDEQIDNVKKAMA
jgi:hypothetical protein